MAAATKELKIAMGQLGFGEADRCVPKSASGTIEAGGAGAPRFSRSVARSRGYGQQFPVLRPQVVQANAAHVNLPIGKHN